MSRFSLIVYLLVFKLLLSCTGHSQDQGITEFQTEVPEIVYEELFDRVKTDEQTLYVVNFWATWCKPCVEELPEFINVNNKYSSRSDFKMYLVSMDFAKNKERLVVPFIAKNQVTAEVLLMNDNKRMNTWISLIDESWSGAIPATVIYKGGRSIFFKEGKMTEKELEEIINEIL